MRSAWRTLILLIQLPALASASQSLQSGTGTASPLPKTAPWTNVANWRAELRIHDFTFDDTYQQIFVTASYSLRLGPDHSALITSWQDGSAACSIIGLTGRQDLILRFQRDAANSLLTAEAWNAADGSGYVQAACRLTRIGSPNDGGFYVYAGGVKGSVAYVRVYSTLVPLQTAPSNTFNGDLLDYEFEGNGNDLARGMNLKFDASAYKSTPTYPPGVIFGQYPASRTFQAGAGSIVVDGSSTFTSTDNATLTYSWQQLDGPSVGSFDDPSAPSTTFSAAAPGTYVLQLTATDNLGKTSSHQLKYGAVLTDANGYITSGDRGIDYILGPLTMWGTSPWPWYDLTERADADTLLPYVTQYPDPGTPLSGTVSLVSTNIYAPPTITGTDTHFTTELKAGDGIAFAWTAPDGLTGQWRATVTAIGDDTHLRVDSAGNPRPFPLLDITASKIDRSQYIYWGDNQNVTTNWNFYDDALALYRLYYRTGIDDYLTAARALADGWYHYALDHGYLFNPPRFASLQGIILRALDGRPEYWNGLMFYMNYPLGWTSQFNQTTPLPKGSQIEPRENGYTLRWAAIAAKLYPDPAVRAQWCASIANSVTNVWPYSQDDLGNLEEDIYNENPTYPYKSFQGRYGSSPWRGTIALLGLQQAYDVLIDPAACNKPDAAHTALTAMAMFADFVHDYGTGSGRGQLYSVNYETLGQSPLGYSALQDQSTPFTTGSVAVTRGSVEVNGDGSNFTIVFSGVSGAVNAQAPKQSGVPIHRPTKYIGIPAGAPCNLVFQVASVESDTHLTLTEPWPSTCPSAAKVSSSIGWVATWEADRDCGSLATYCEGGPAGDRNLTHDIHAAYLWTWRTTGAQKYWDWASDSLGADYGGPAGGPGTTGPGFGPFADGATGNFSDPLPPCQTSGPPCGGYGPVLAMGKALGMSAGAGNAPNAIAIYTVSQQAAGPQAASARKTRGRGK